MKPIAPNQQMAAVVAIHTRLLGLRAANDAASRLDRLAGETDLLAMIDQLLAQIAVDTAAAEAIAAQIAQLAGRQARSAEHA
jgi:hypothetical protein